MHEFAYLPGGCFILGHAVNADFMADQAADVIRTLARAAVEGTPANMAQHGLPDGAGRRVGRSTLDLNDE